MSDTPWTGAEADKLYLTSGQFETTFKTSASISSFSTGASGHEYDGINTVWNDTLKNFLTAGQFGGLLTSGGVAFASPNDISFDGLNTLVNTQTKFFLLSGQFTDTRKDSLDVSGVDNSAQGISWDGTNTPWTGNQADKLYLQSGQFDSALKTSQSVSALDNNSTGHSWDGTNTLYIGTTSDKLFLISGQFTSTVKSSIDQTTIDIQPFGISTNNITGRWGASVFEQASIRFRNDDGDLTQAPA